MKRKRKHNVKPKITREEIINAYTALKEASEELTVLRAQLEKANGRAHRYELRAQQLEAQVA